MMHGIIQLHLEIHFYYQDTGLSISAGYFIYLAFICIIVSSLEMAGIQNKKSVFHKSMLFRIWFLLRYNFHGYLRLSLLHESNTLDQQIICLYSSRLTITGLAS